VEVAPSVLLLLLLVVVLLMLDLDGECARECRRDARREGRTDWTCEGLKRSAGAAARGEPAAEAISEGAADCTAAGEKRKSTMARRGSPPALRREGECCRDGARDSARELTPDGENKKAGRPRPATLDAGDARWGVGVGAREGAEDWRAEWMVEGEKRWSRTAARVGESRASRAWPGRGREETR
jgi:hypothetical protein